MAGTSG